MFTLERKNSMTKVNGTRLDRIVDQARQRSEGQVFARLADLRSKLKDEKPNDIDRLCAYKAEPSE